jgi:hypothetical protein
MPISPRCASTPTSRSSKGGTDAADLIPLTVPEVRCLLLALADPPGHAALRLAWSVFRRRHQACAKRCHTARRARQPRLTPASGNSGGALIHLLPARPFALNDAQWARIVPLLPPQKPHTSRSNHDHRTFLAGMLWILQTGSAWRELPQQFGPWHTVYGRYQRWRRAGSWQQVLDVLSPEQEDAPA